MHRVQAKADETFQRVMSGVDERLKAAEVTTGCSVWWRTAAESVAWPTFPGLLVERCDGRNGLHECHVM